MCNQESHQQLNQFEHFTRHTIEVERVCAATRRGLGEVSIEQAMQDAHDALELASDNTPAECTRMLRLVVEGDLDTAAH